MDARGGQEGVFMKIYVDVSVLVMAPFLTGIQRVTREITLRLIRDPMVEAVLVQYHQAQDSYYRIDNQMFFRYYARHKGIREQMATRQKVPLSEIGHGTVFFDLDAAWMSRVRRSYLLPVLKKQGAVIVAHIYDIISVTHPQYCLQRGVCLFMDFLGAHLQYADACVVNAQATVTELKRLTDQIGCALPTCVVIPLGADFCEKKTMRIKRVQKSLVQTVNKSRPYLLMTGTIEPRKNHKLLLQAYDQGLHDIGYRIIFAGSLGWDMDAFVQDMKRHPDYGTRIFWFCGLNDEELSYLYRHARFLFFGSYTEGYGLPVLEALQRGTPVLASDIPVTREVAGDYCVYFAQDQAQQICDRVAYYHSHRAEYEALRERIRNYRPFDWNSCYLRMREQLYQTAFAGQENK